MDNFDTIDDGSTIVDPIQNVDYTQSDNSSPSVVSVDYWRTKVNDFQTLLNTLDPIYYNLQSAVADLQIDSSDAGAALYQQGLDVLSEYENKRSMIVSAAQAVNLASDGMNAMGISFPRVQYGGVNAVPILGLAAVLGTIAAVTAVIIAWVNHAKDYSGEVLSYIQTLPSEQQGPLLEKFMQVNAATQQAQVATSQSTGAQAISLFKWALVLGGGFLAYKMFKELK